MNATQKQYMQSPEKFREIVWDYAMTPHEFFSVLSSQENAHGSINQDWAITRILEHVPYYDARALIPMKTLKERWEYIKPRIFNKEIAQGYEYVLRRNALSTTRY